MQSSIERTLFAILKRHFKSDNIQRGELIQRLWSGYGEIVRYQIASTSVVVKVVNPSGQGSHPRGWNTSWSHQRKLDSYQNEQVFYAGYTHQTDRFCQVPKFLARGECEGLHWLVMDDLDARGFTYRCDQASLSLVDKGIRWLAYFHARFLGQQATDLWPVGTYWHLATRPDEFETMVDGDLKQQANQIDRVLNQAQFQTVVHGDAKLANFCFRQDQQDLAAVDFQYVGRGAGVKDVAYFLGSCLHNEGLHAHAGNCLNRYFQYLEAALTHYQVKCDFAAVEHEWRALYPFAWADFERFLLGWASDHIKLTDYSQQQTQQAIKQLS